MPLFRPKQSDHIVVDKDKKKIRLLKNEVFENFNPDLLGLGDIGAASSTTDAIAAVFDLEGFTNFCKQIEPHLSVPLFLSEFLGWLLDDLKAEMVKKTEAEGVALWCPLPFFVKFMGDGILVLWDAAEASAVGRRNIILSAKQVCDHYKRKFLPKIQKKVVMPPPILRCGMARGSVYSVGNGNDYVGSCINMAARLQKIGGTTFAFNRRGFDLEDPDAGEFFSKDIVVKKLPIRGIGDDELVGVLAKEFNALKPADKKQFKEV